MARRETNRGISLGGHNQPPHGGDDLGRAMADISASAQIRDRNQLPSKVKVITPQVIMSIVQGITDKLGMQIDRDEFNQLVMQQTQMEMQLQQAQEKLEQYKTEYKKVYDAWQEANSLLQQQGDGDNAGMQAQLAEAQERAVNAVDTYMALQQQLDELTEQYASLESQLQDREAALLARDDEVASLQQQVEGAGADPVLLEELEALRAQVAELQEAAARVDELQDEVQALEARLKDGNRSQAKSEHLQAELEQLRTAEGDWLEEKRRLANQISNETNLRRAAEEKLEAMQSGKELPASAKAIEERAKQATAELAKAQAELKALQEEFAKSGNAAKELSMLKRKYEGIEAELEGLRAAEGKWLEEKRRLAAQLSNETNLRRDLETKLGGELEQAKSEVEAGKKNSKPWLS